MTASRTTLVAGASGFVGRHLCPALAAAGLELRCASRDPERAAGTFPDARWTYLDVDDECSVARALRGCRYAVYLVHGLAHGDDLEVHETRAAQRFAAAAGRALLERLVYVGSVEPRGRISTHLQSRLRTGRILRQGFVATVELRASMVVGPGSASFELVRALAARAPLVLEPPWLGYRSCPVAIEDLVAAVLGALLHPALPPGCYDVPGPEAISHREILRRTAAMLGHEPAFIQVPALSSRWAGRAVAWLAHADDDLGRLLLEGLRSDLVPEPGHSIWDELPAHRLRPVDAALHDAVFARQDAAGLSAPMRATLVRIGTRLAAALGS